MWANMECVQLPAYLQLLLQFSGLFRKFLSTYITLGTTKQYATTFKVNF